MIIDEWKEDNLLFNAIYVSKCRASVEFHFQDAEFK